MSQKRTFSQLTEDYLTQDTVQSLDLLEDMPARVPRRNAMSKSRKMLVRKSRVPRPLRTRGTPAGYYEIPVTVYRKLYFNMSTGLWNTDPYTGVTSGSTGYNGFGMGTQLDTSNMLLGNGGTSALVNVSVPGFSQLQSVFDEVKIARIDYEIWVNGQAHENGSTLRCAPNIWVVRDDNNIDPPSGLSEILQYSNVISVKGDITKPTRFSVYPRVRVSIGSSEVESGTSSTIAGDAPGGYYQTAKPSVQHFGLRGWFETQSTMADAYLGYVCIKETQIRRYKMNK